MTKTWEQQAADSLPGPGHHPYQSQYVAFAVRAAETFAPFHAPNGMHDPTGAHQPIMKPHPDKTAICCQVPLTASGTYDNCRLRMSSHCLTHICAVLDIDMASTKGGFIVALAYLRPC